MKLVRAGYTAIIIAVLLFVSLSIYNADTYIDRLLLYSMSIILFVLGIFLIYVHNTLTSLPFTQNTMEVREHFVEGGFIIPITIDNCVIKGNNYREEILQDGFGGRYKLLDELIDPIKNVRYNDVSQSVVIYNYTDGINNVRMVSRTFNFDAVSLERMIKMGKVNLHIDKLDKSKYMYSLDLSR